MDKINRTFGVLKEKGIFSTRTLTVAILGIMIITLFSIAGNVGSGAVTPESCFKFDPSTGTITVYVGDFSNVVIPSKIGGVPVTKIGISAFEGCTSLTSITIPDAVTTIGDNAFAGCSSLTSITLPDAVTTIGYDAFRGCIRLTSITLPDAVTKIGDSAFAYCSRLTSITIPDGVTKISDYAFYDCTRLTSITLPDAVTTIGEWAFAYCTGLSSITLPNAVTTIGELAFSDCTNLETITNLRASAQDIHSSSFEDTCVGGIAYAYPSNTKFINIIKAAGYTVKGVPPSINYTLSPSTLTNQDVKVTVSAKASSGVIEETKWAMGKAGIDYFATMGAAFNDYFYVDYNDIYTIYARDTSGSESVKEFTITNIDKVPPQQPTVFADTTELTEGSVTVTAMYSSDTMDKLYRVDGGNWQYYPSMGITVDVNCVLDFKGTDEAYNDSDIVTYVVDNIDRTPPLMPILKPSTSLPTNKNVIVTIEYPDDAVVREYRIGSTGAWMDYTAGISLSSNNTIYARCQDLIGHWSTTGVLRVDNIDKVAPKAPTASADITVPTNKNVTVTATFSSDTKTKQYSKNNGTWATYTGGIIFTLNGNVKFRGYDAAGNVSSSTTYTVSNIDKVAPVITINNYTKTPTNKDIVVTASTDKGTLNATSHTFTVNGSYTFIATDSVGNTTSETVTITNIDKVAPVITINPYETRPTDKDIKVTATVNKGTLDVSEYIFTLNGSFTFRAGDEYGNTTEKTVTITNIYKDGVFDGFVFDGKTGTIVGYNGNETDITLPSVIKGVPVVSIGDYAFKGKGIESLVIPDSVEYIGKEAFANNGLGGVRIPNNTSFSPDSFNGNGAELVIIVTEETLAYDSAIKTFGINILVLPKPVVETLEVIGNIEATVISITVPTSIEFVANQEDGSIISSNFELINNTNVDLGVSLCDFSLSKNSPHTFIDVLPDEKDWSRLGVLDSKTYISLGLKPLKTDGDGWVVCLVNQPIYVKEIDDMIELGTVRNKSGVSFEVVGNTGRAFIETVRVIYDLVFMFELR